ncbi:uncharacterized protein LOC133802609 [Humulus lupulus]|uniref:uncharacterized protein LOC133802609 n=1 Tax=Humulus lupulus TaxID=3486 RepID=UPI002B401B2E|nr:uncharacterized protein LOC133802609 [Humulus lupulus]
MMLIAWNNFLDDECIAIKNAIEDIPIVLAKRVKVGSYKGVSIATIVQSFLLIEPKLPAGDVLMDWCVQPIMSFYTSVKIKCMIPLHLPYRHQMVISKIFPQYITSALHKGHKGKGVGRSCVQVHLKDNTTALPATIFGSVAKQFLNCSTTQLLQLINEGVCCIFLWAFKRKEKKERKNGNFENKGSPAIRIRPVPPLRLRPTPAPGPPKASCCSPLSPAGPNLPRPSPFLSQLPPEATPLSSHLPP